MYLSERNTWYSTHRESEKRSLNFHDNCKSLTLIKKNKEYVWLSEVTAQVLQQSLRDLDKAFTRFFKGLSAFPKFKKKHGKQSFRVQQDFVIDNLGLHLPKFEKPIPMEAHRLLDGTQLFVTIKKTPSGKYFCCVTVEKEISQLPTIDHTVGIDLGLKDFLVTSDGEKISNPKFLRQREKTLKYEQRQLSKKEKGSKSREKQRKIVAAAHEKIRNQRKDFLHKQSTKLINDNQVICLESLSVKNMMQNHKLAKSIADSGWGMFVGMLKYKAEWYGRTISQIDRFYPSSKLCGTCGYINEELKLSDREWICPGCGTNHDRDVNAAKNILRQGLNLVAGSGIDSVEKQAEAPALVGSMKPEAFVRK